MQYAQCLTGGTISPYLPTYLIICQQSSLTQVLQLAVSHGKGDRPVDY